MSFQMPLPKRHLKGRLLEMKRGLAELCWSFCNLIQFNFICIASITMQIVFQALFSDPEHDPRAKINGKKQWQVKIPLLGENLLAKQMQKLQG